MTIRQQKMEKAKLQTGNVLHPSMPLWHLAVKKLHTKELIKTADLP